MVKHLSGCRISTEWMFKGMRTLIMENEYLRIVVLLDKGSDIIEFLYKPLDVDFMWHSPLGYRNPSMFVETCSRMDGSFLDYYGGGWQDILPNAGGACAHRGAEWGQHGETALIPWRCTIEKETSEEVIAHLNTKCYRYPFTIDKWIILRRKEKILTIREKLTNESEQSLEFSWLQHLTFGEPFLSPKCVIDLAAETVLTHTQEIPGSILPVKRKFKWPVVEGKHKENIDLSRIPPKNVRSHDLAYLMDLREGWYGITNTEMKLGFGLIWDKSVYPYIWFWRPLGGAWDYPWFGRAWAIGLEPCTSWPATGLIDQIKEGTAAKINGKSSIETEIKAVVYTGFKRVKNLFTDGTVEGVEEENP